MIKEVHQYISTGLKDANIGGLAQDFSVNFNNPSITSVVNNDTPTLFQPVYIALDWVYKNVTAKLKNNKLTFRTPLQNGVRPDYLYDFNGVNQHIAVNSITVTLNDDSYSPSYLASELQRILNATSPIHGVGWFFNNARTAMNWVVEYDATINALAINFTTEYPGGVQAIEIVYIDNTQGSEFNSAKIFGFIDALGLEYFTLPRANAFTLVGTTRVLTDTKLFNPNIIDLKVYDVIRLHSNVAKRYLTKSGSSLSNSDILLEILIPNNYNNGDTILIDYSSSPEIWKQTIQSNFDYITFTLKDKNSNIIELEPGCNFDITFKITRYITSQSKEDRLFNINSSNQTIGMI